MPDSLKAVSMFASPAFAQAAGAAAPSGVASLLQFVPYIAIFAIFYVLMIRPQQKRAAEHRAMIDAVKKGDEVVTGGGLVGKVVRVMDAEVEIELAPQLKVKAIKATLADVRNRTAPVAANDVKG
jgi:preprotein translocase subunit YajC